MIMLRNRDRGFSVQRIDVVAYGITGCQEGAQSVRRLGPIWMMHRVYTTSVTALMTRFSDTPSTSWIADVIMMINRVSDLVGHVFSEITCAPGYFAYFLTDTG